MKKDYIAAPPGELYWRYEKCPYAGSKVLLRTIGGVCISGHWYGAYGEYLTAWCPLPKDGAPQFEIQNAKLWARIKFSFNLIFRNSKCINTST